MEKILLVVITDNEYKALHPFLSIQDNPRYFGKSFVEQGTIAEKEVFLCKMGDMGSRTKGSVAASLAPIIDEIKPSIVIEVGICFGMKSDFKIGDVCISKLTFDYEYQKIEDGATQNRLRHLDSPGEIFTPLSHFALHYSNEFSVRTGNYACGDKVVDDQAFKDKIKNAIPDAVVGDMESYSLALICDEKKIPWCVIKASSDDGVNKNDDNQIVAARNAAQFTKDFLEQHDLSEKTTSMEVDVHTDHLFFEAITQEITGKKNFKTETVTKNRAGLHIHHHPDMGDAWILVYLYKATSIPEALRTLIKHWRTAPFRVDLCVISREEISEPKLNTYLQILRNAGCQKIYVNVVKKFIYERVVKELSPSASLLSDQNYVDQKVFIEGGHAVSSRRYATSFIKDRADSIIPFKPISVILGQGGIGKTTLCKNIAAHFERLSSKNEHLLLITKSDILNGHSGMPINSITDLYREYRNEINGMTNAFGERSFEIALSSGSLVVMIDGIDEIESALGDKFNMDSFIDSIGAINSTLGSCKVFLTSRPFNSERFYSLDNTNVVELKGFSAEDVNDYLSKLPPAIDRTIRRIASKLQTPSGFVNPYLLSTITRICTESEIGTDEISSQFLDSSVPFEFVLSKLLAREIEKQSLGISVDTYYELLDHIIVDCANTLTLHDFQTYIDTMLSTAGTSSEALSESYLKCLLFKISEESVSIEQDEYVVLLRTKALYSILSGEKAANPHQLQRAMSILGGDPTDSLGVRENTNRLLLERKISAETVNSALKNCFEGFKPFIEAKIPRAKNAIYAIHQFAQTYNRPKGATEAMQVLELLHTTNKITNMYIYGDFPPLDFSGKTLEHCEFIGYKKFLRGRVNHETKFRKCRFANSSDLSSTDFTGEMFEEDCSLDEALKLAISFSRDKKEGREARVRSDIKHILKVMRLGLGFNPKSLNKIKQNTSLLSGKSYEILLSALCRHEVLSFDPESGTYSVLPQHHSQALSLCEENDARGTIKKLIFELSN